MTGRSVVLAAPADGATVEYVRNGILAHEPTATVHTFDYRRLAAEVGHHAMSQHLLEEVRARHGDLLLVLKGESIEPQTLRRAGRHAKVALWNFDVWLAKDRAMLERAEAADHYFLPTRGLVDFHREHGITANYLPEGCDPTRHQPFPAQRQTFPITFVGTIAGVDGREEWATALRARFKDRLHLWGSFPGHFETWPNHHGRAEGDDRLNIVVGHTQVNLDRQRNPELEGTYGARIYRTLAARGFLVTNRIVGIDEDFANCLATYTDTRDCLDIVSHYLDHPEECVEIAATGRRKVLAHDTFEDRIARLFSVVGL